MIEGLHSWWTEEFRLQCWKQVEWAASRAQEELRRVPVGVAKAVMECEVNTERMQELEREYQHDVAAFVQMLQEQTKPEVGRFVHYGLTSSDVVDTGSAIQWSKSMEMLIDRLDRLHHDTECKLPAHGTMHQLALVAHHIEVGKLSGPMGTYSSVEPDVEKLALDLLGMRPEDCATQIICRDRFAWAVCCLAALAMEFRDKEAVTFLSGWCSVSLQNMAVWHERDISHSSAERVMWPQVWSCVERMLSSRGV